MTSYAPGPNAQNPGWAYPAPAPAVPPQTGVGAWLQFLWWYVPVPVIGNIAWLAGAVASWLKHRRSNGPARENARHALNWAITANAIMVLAIVCAFLTMFTSQGWDLSQSVPGDHPGVVLYVAFLLVVPVTGITTLIVGIVGAVRAGRGDVLRVPVAIPFVRGTNQQEPGRPA
ncbi:DUF4870 domain-containing protein [Pseudoclavibacter endophyticus]|uniref:DUF4870 domain-containing protein n=1 Tax=Pseudoclavibacter endophyticus TaxID=1778590 RepID=A0A6H9WAI8_9MICO|nr:DUF4870 domain-containing protein [Pseudoclavibacter endophyticus]KAB1646734.1 DUF4870 domain-containing protein [Pseudoclavibacter endophyticus]